MLKGCVFRDAKADELEGDAEPGQGRAQRNQPSLGGFAFAAAALGAPEEAGHERHVRDDDVAAIAGKDAFALPSHLGVEALFISTYQTSPEGLEERQVELLAGLAEGLLGHGAYLEVATELADDPPGLEQALGHGFGVQGHVHHQPSDDFWNERALSFGSTSGLLGHDPKFL